MRHRPLAHRFFGLAFALAIPSLAGRAAAATVLPDGFVDTVVTTGLKQPVGMAWLPDGRLLVIEQNTANLRLVVQDTLAAAPLFTVPDVNANFLERGLLGIAVDPAYPTRPYVYFFLSHLGTPTTSYVVRYALTGDLSDPTSANLQVDPTSAFPILTDIPDDAVDHNGGTLRFGPDGLLYVSVGDDNIPCASQSLGNLHGALLRLDVSGLPAGGPAPPPKSALIPAGNPFSGPDDNTRLTIAYGLRNPFRFHVDPATGRIFIADVGQAAFEEIDLLEPTALGQNFGWPLWEGPFLTGTTCAGVPATTPFTAPIAFYNRSFVSDAAMISAGVYHAVHYPLDRSFPPAYEGDYFYSDYYAGFLRRLHRQPDGTWAPAPLVSGQPNATDWAGGISTTSDYSVGPDGALYYISQFGSGGSLHRIGAVPTLTLSASNAQGQPGNTGVPVAVQASAAVTVGSTDVRLRFDPTALQASGVTSGLEGFGFAIDNVAGLVTTASASTAGQLIPAGGTLFTVAFDVLPGASGCSSIAVEDADGVPPDDLGAPGGTGTIPYRAVAGSLCVSVCGNGTLEAGEQCDDGNRADGDCCSAICRFESAGSACAGTPCTVGRVCDGQGKCGGGTARSCDDDNPCTTESCDAVTGCQHTAVANGTSCGDGNACNGAETCQAGVCAVGPPLVCDDGNACTTDSCDPTAGCQHASVTDGTACSDGNVCNGAETCQAGTCAAGTPLACDDGNACTTDSCDPAAGCQHTSVANGTACSDGNACNGAETCQSGTCTAGPALACDDNNACTTDSCDPALGCRHVRLPGCTSCTSDADCTDGNACNGTERCAAGSCAPGTPPVCDDGNPCTDDTCDPAAGCVHANNTAPCSDGNACTTGDRCSGGTCAASGAPSCDDGNPCTTDSCDPGVGCIHTPGAPTCQSLDAVIIAKVPNPLGGGNHDLEVIRDGDTPPVGNQQPLRQYDSWDGPNTATEDWIGYDYGTPQLFTRVVFQEGMHFVDGGWFETLTAQVRQHGSWVEAPAVTITPAYPGVNDGISYQTYTLDFAPVAGDAIRIYGAPGGSADFISVGELSAAHAPDPAPTADAGPDQSVSPGQLVVLDGSASSHPAGAPLGYHWTQTGGPTVELSDAGAVRPTFTAPALPATTAFTFGLIVDDGALASAAATTVVTVDAGVELTHGGTIIARVPFALGGGNHNLEVIRDGDMPPVGNQDSSRQYDTWDGPNAATEDWIGYDYAPVLHSFSRVVFQEGRHFVDGGWFADVTVQVRQGGLWNEVPGLTIAPPYPGINDGVSYETYTFQFPPTVGDAIRVYGTPGGSAAFISVGELEVFGTGLPVEPPTADAGADQDVRSGQLVTLDGTGSSDAQGRPITYLWTQTAGPPVVLSDPTAAQPTFIAPQVLGATTLGFTLSVSNGNIASGVDAIVVIVRDAADLTHLGTIIAAVPSPLGGGNHDLEVIRDGDRPPVGNQDSKRQYDSWDGPNAAAADWIGYDYGSVLHTFSAVAFQEGKHFVDGGWFQTLTVQVRHGGVWHEVSSLTITPAYPGADDGVSYQTYLLQFAPVAGDAIRLYGAPGGSAAFISVGELEVFGAQDALQSPTADAGPDQEVRPGQLVTLDAGGSIDPQGRPLTYLWTQTGGPAVALSDPTAAQPTFAAPAADDVVTLAFAVEVANGLVGSGPATTTVTVRDPGNLTHLGAIIARVPDPLGGGNHDLEVIRDGDLPPVGNQDSFRQYDSWDGPNAAADDWIGYDYAPTTHTFTRIVFQEGRHFVDGGWFTSLTAQVRQGGVWQEVSGLTVTPAYPGIDDGVTYETYTLRFTPAVGDAIRIFGVPGGSAAFISVGELRVFDDCGDGIVTPPEQCDPPGTATCADDCTLRPPTCGDGIVTPPEECDDGNLNDCDGCSSHCTIPPISFACDVLPIFANAGCAGCHGVTSPAAKLLLDPAFPHATFTNLVAHASGEQPLVMRVAPGDSADSYLLMKELGAAGISGRRMPANNPTYFDAHADQLALQSLWIDQGATEDACAVTCLSHFCGDGVVTPFVEECDDGNADPNDGCGPTCRVEFCGDGIVNNGNEQCEPPNTDTCAPDCTLR